MTPNPVERRLLDALATIDAPDPARAGAIALFAGTGLPHRRLEAWKWSDLRAAVELPDRPALEDALAVARSRAPDARTPLVSAPTTALPALAAAVAGEAEVFTPADGETLTLDVAAAPGVGARVVGVTVPAGARARVEERYRGDPLAFANMALLFRLGEGARLERTVVQAASPGAAIVVTAAAELSAGAELAQTTLAFGAKLARLETHVIHEGEGASATLDGAYLLDGRLHADQTSTVRHGAPGGTTRQLVKGAVRGQATGVFQGKFLVERAGQKTDARMAHHALILSEGASVNAKPELEIWADDVQCAHGNTAGALDPLPLFYLESRGLPEAEARALLIEAFVAETLERVTDEALRARLLEAIRTWLGRGGR